MTVPTARGPIVIDADGYGADIVAVSRLSRLYEPTDPPSPAPVRSPGPA